MAMDAPSVLDAVVRHQVDLERFKAGSIKRILSFVRKMRADMIERLAANAVSDWQRTRAISIIAQLDDIVAAAVKQIEEHVRIESRGLIEGEMEFHAAFLNQVYDLSLSASFDVVTVNTVYAAALSQPFQGAPLAEWVQGFDEGIRRRLSRELRLSFAEGESLRQTVSRISDISDMTTRQSTALARTALQHMSVFAQRRAYQEADATHWVYVAVLDSRTTAECRGRSGKVYAISDTAPWPPRHMQCRSSAMPLDGIRAVPDIPSYSEWLSRQPIDVQDDILGKAKAQLFRKGDLSLDKFIDRKGAELTLAQLRKRYPRAWRRSGLDQAA